MTNNMDDTSPPEQQQQQEQTDQDTILFGSTPFVIFGEFSDRIDAALTEGVSSLPLLPKKDREDAEGGDEKLMRLLRKAYVKNVDLAEAYAHRNIFTIQHLPPTRRRNIVQAFLDKNALPTPREVDSTKHTDDKDDSYRYPTKDEIPSSNEIKEMQDETKQLREKLRDARRRRNKLLNKLEHLATVDESAKVAARALQDSTNTAQLHKSVSSVLKSKENLDKLCKDGAQLAHELDQEKRQRQEEDGDELIVQAPPQKKLTLEEEYEQQRKFIQTTPNGMQKLKEFLKQR